MLAGVTALLSVASSCLVGIVLILAPWSDLWETNSLLQLHPDLRMLLLSTFTRGAVTGLGLVNILLAAVDARAFVRSHDGRS
jgi:hypothetical protein